MTDQPMTVAILAVPGVIPLDFGIPAHIFGNHGGYRVIVCGDGSAGSRRTGRCPTWRPPSSS
ncbi:hypothetical protein [Kribbella sp. NPDC006257]|uniref:hypothetical protein n=1 Tax=Kribbella sp. NPDC006257 TaxID=3156738 RepID=UPI0033AC409A